MTPAGAEVRCTVCMKTFIKSMTSCKHDTAAYERHAKTAKHQKMLREMAPASTEVWSAFLGKGKEQIQNYLTSVIYGVQGDQ